jgi:hypothetical protein
MNRRAIEAIDYRLQVVDAMQKNGGLDVPSIGNVATDGGKFERLLCAIEFQKKMGFAATPCFAGRAIRLKPFPCHRPGKSCRNPSCALAVAGGLAARKMSSMCTMIGSSSTSTFHSSGPSAQRGRTSSGQKVCKRARFA